jgi:hypothetical protein
LGPEADIQLVEDRAPDGFVRVEDVIGRETLEAIAMAYATSAGLDASAVNNRPSFVNLPGDHASKGNPAYCSANDA